MLCVLSVRRVCVLWGVLYDVVFKYGCVCDLTLLCILVYCFCFFNNFVCYVFCVVCLCLCVVCVFVCCLYYRYVLFCIYL